MLAAIRLDDHPLRAIVHAKRDAAPGPVDDLKPQMPGAVAAPFPQVGGAHPHIPQRQHPHVRPPVRVAPGSTLRPAKAGAAPTLRPLGDLKQSFPAKPTFRQRSSCQLSVPCCRSDAPLRFDPKPTTSRAKCSDLPRLSRLAPPRQLMHATRLPPSPEDGRVQCAIAGAAAGVLHSTFVIPAPRVPDGARAGPGRDPCSSEQPRAQLVRRATSAEHRIGRLIIAPACQDVDAGHFIRNGMRCYPRSSGAHGPHIRAKSKLWLAWVPAFSRLLASLLSGAGMTKVECKTAGHARRQLRFAVSAQNSGSKQRRRTRGGQTLARPGNLA